MSFIQAHELVKSYGTGQARVDALRGVGFMVNQGEFAAVMGPSGSGKSTLLSLLGALTTPTSGSYVVDDQDIFELNSDQRADFRRDYLGFVFQNFHLVKYLTLEQNLMLPLVTRKMKPQAKREMAQEALARVGLADLARRLPGQISGGEQERTAVARALVNQPPILLADEPTGNLDEATSREIMKLLSLLHHEGMTILMVTHSPACAAYASRLIQLSDGRLISDVRGSDKVKRVLPHQEGKDLRSAA